MSVEADIEIRMLRDEVAYLRGLLLAQAQHPVTVTVTVPEAEGDPRDDTRRAVTRERVRRFRAARSAPAAGPTGEPEGPAGTATSVTVTLGSVTVTPESAPVPPAPSPRTPLPLTPSRDVQESGLRVEESKTERPPLTPPSESDEQLVLDGGFAPSDDPVVLTFPVQGRRGEWHLYRSQVVAWTELYPGVPVEAACRRALAWVRAVAGRRKTHRGMAAFLVNWLNRDADRAAAPRGVAPAPHVPTQDWEAIAKRTGRWQPIDASDPDAGWDSPTFPAGVAS